MSEQTAITTGDNPSPWAVDSTTWAKKELLFEGDGKGNFDWQGAMTREAFATVLYRYDQTILNKS